MKIIFRMIASLALILGLAVPAFAAFATYEEAMVSVKQKVQKKDYAGVRLDAAEAFELGRTPSEKAAAIRPIATSWLNEKNGLARAVAEYDKALALPALPVRDRTILLTDLAKAYENNGDRAAAIPVYERILADPESDNRARILALNGIAGNQLETWKIKEANETIRKAPALPGLKPEEQATALANIGALEMRQTNYATARAVYTQMLMVSTTAANRVNVDQLMTAAWVAEGNFDKAIEINRQPGREMELAAVYQKQGKLDEARAELRTLLANQGDKPNPVAFSQLLKLSKDVFDFNTARADGDLFLPALMAKDKSRAAELMGLLKDSMEKGDYPFAAWSAALVIQATNLPPRDYLLSRVYQVNALGALGKAADARALALAAGSDEKLAAAERARFTLTAAALDAAAKPGAMKAAAEKAFAVAKPDELTATDKATAILKAAKSAMMAGREVAARELYALYQGLLANPARRVYTCEFVSQAPSDPGGWLASPLLKEAAKKAKMDRKVAGENLELLLATDATTADRGITAQGQAGDKGETETEFVAVCDPDGLSLVFLASDPRVGEVARGLVTGGSYEGYLAAGPDQPYYTFLVDLAAGTLSDGFRTMYPNRYFRLAQAKDKTVRSLTTTTDKGFVTTLFYPWELFFDRLPRNGDAWPFDNIRWTRAGGYSWAGSQSVHNRSSWGDLVFSGLTDPDRREIKRRLVYKAFAKYKLESNFNAKGDIARWKDTELGDPAFYNAALAPLVAKLDGLAAKVGKDMPDADVDLLFEQAVPDWMTFKYRAAELRTAWLSDKFFR